MRSFFYLLVKLIKIFMQTWFLTLSLIFISFIYARIGSHLSQKRGRNIRTGFWIGFFFGLIGLLILFLLPVKEKQEKNILLTNTSKKENTNHFFSNPLYLDKLWYYLDNQKQKEGPMSLNKLKKEWEEGKIFPSTYLWSEGMEKWEKLKNLFENHSF